MQPQARHQFLKTGEPVPWFVARTRSKDAYQFNTVAGRYIVLAFFGTASQPPAAALLDGIQLARERFDDEQLAFFGVSTDAPEAAETLQDSIPGIRFFWDVDKSLSALCGVVAENGDYRPVTYVLDPALRVVAALRNTDAAHFAALLAVLDRLPPIPAPYPVPPHAPVLVLPRVFEPALCRTLIEYYERAGGKDSGFMRDVDGKTKLIVDHAHKRRRDVTIEDEALRNTCMVRIHDRLIPEIAKAFQFRATRMERYLISCYDAQEGGHFRPHRDNTTKGTAHRRFAVSLFLNSGEYEGGLLRFAEYGAALYSAPTGGAVVFGCSLLHEATPVTRGRRYMFLPFLYDAEAARLRAKNQQYLDRDSLSSKEESEETGS